jgi:flagellum-specific ATP synthase
MPEKLCDRDLESIRTELRNINPLRMTGELENVIGLLLESRGPSVPIGELCEIFTMNGKFLGYAEVVGFREERILLMPLGEIKGISRGCSVLATNSPFRVAVGPDLLGRVVDGQAVPIDGKGPVNPDTWYRVDADPTNPVHREKIDTILPTGVKVIDAFVTCGKGQRFGLFAGSGLGKSLLLGMIARYSMADVNVIALLGERGREVNDFIQKSLGERGLRKSVVVAVTSDQPALTRVRGASVAMSIAEYFRDQGRDVMLLLDSITRIAMAQREIGLAIGEPPTTKGYTPSVYALLPRLLERAGRTDRGTITGIYTVLVEGDDMSEPVSDIVRSILDGHIMLSRSLASRNHYPAVDVLHSLSRLMVDIVDRNHVRDAAMIRELLAVYRDSEDLINIGAYRKGSNEKIDRAMKMMDSINGFLRQDLGESCEFGKTIDALHRLSEGRVIE